MSSLSRVKKIQKIRYNYPKLYRDLKKHVPKLVKKPEQNINPKDFFIYNALIKVYQYGKYSNNYNDLERLKF